MGQRLAGNAARRKASWVVPPFSPPGEKLSSGPIPRREERWNDPGQAGETDHAHPRGCTGRQLPVGLEPIRWCPRTTRDVRGRDDFGEGSSSRRIGTTKRGGSASRTPRGVAVPQARVRLQRWRCKRRHRGERVHRGRIDRSGRKRIAASPLPGSGRANGSGPGQGSCSKRRFAVVERARARTAESVFNRTSG